MRAKTRQGASCFAFIAILSGSDIILTAMEFRKRSLLCFLIPLGTLGCSVSAQAGSPRTETYEGVATRVGAAGRPLVYRELHQVTYDGDRVLAATTRYLLPDGKVRATLDSRFPGTAYLPDYTFKDSQGSIEEGVRCCSTDSTLEVHHQGKSKKLGFKPDWVSGQGFHYFSKDSLEKLAAGEQRLLEFLIPSRLEPFSFRIRSGENTDLSKSRVEVVLEVQSWILRLFAPKIRATYDLKTRRLVHYLGPSNLLDAKGDVQTVEIHYQYPAAQAP